MRLRYKGTLEGRALLLYRLRFRCALLRVNHYPLECVNGAQHLWIFGLDDIDFVLWLNASGIAQSIESALLFSGHADANIWRYAIALNDLSAGRVVLGRGKTHRRSVRQLQHILYRTLSKSGFANQNRSTQILKRACNDLSAARAAFVNQQHHGKIRARLIYRRSGV